MNCNLNLDRIKISSLRKKDVHELLEELAENPSHEIIATLHRIILDYVVNPSSNIESTCLFRISIFRSGSLPSGLQKEFEVLRETSNYARRIDCERFYEAKKRDAREIAGDSTLIKILSYLSSEGPENINEFKNQMGTMSGFQRAAEKGLDKELLLINNKGDEYASLISITHKGRRILKYIRKME